MLVTLIRLLGAWVAIFGLSYGFRFGYAPFAEEKSALEIFLVMIPPLVSLLIGLVYIMLAPKIAGPSRSQGDNIIPVDILPSGLILIGLFWTGNAVFAILANLSYFMSIIYGADSTYYRYNVVLANVFSLVLGLAVLVLGICMRYKSQSTNE